MTVFDWSRYAVGGATRPDSFTGMNPAFAQALEAMFTNAPPEIQAQMRVLSGYRSPGRQTELWNAALKKYGSAAAARKWVAPPGRSRHNHGHAADLRYLDPSARQWAHANAAKFGLSFPLSNEDWHIELAGSRGKAHQAMPGANPDPAPATEGPAAAFAPPPAAPAANESELGRLFATMAPAAQAINDAAYAPSVASGGGFGATMAAQQGAEQARALAMGLRPDVDQLLSLKGRKLAPLG